MKCLQWNKFKTGGCWVITVALVLLLNTGTALGAGNAQSELPLVPGGGIGKARNMSLPEAVFLVVRGNASIEKT